MNLDKLTAFEPLIAVKLSVHNSNSQFWKKLIVTGCQTLLNLPQHHSKSKLSWQETGKFFCLKKRESWIPFERG